MCFYAGDSECRRHDLRVTKTETAKKKNRREISRVCAPGIPVYSPTRGDGEEETIDSEWRSPREEKPETGWPRNPRSPVAGQRFAHRTQFFFEFGRPSGGFFFVIFESYCSTDHWRVWPRRNPHNRAYNMLIDFAKKNTRKQ